MRACPRQLEIEIWVLDLLLMLMIIVSRAVHRSNSPFLNFLWKPHTGPVSQDGRPAAIGQAEGCAYHCRVTPAAILQQFFFRFFIGIHIIQLWVCWVVFHCNLPLLFTIAIYHCCLQPTALGLWLQFAENPRLQKFLKIWNMKCTEKKENIKFDKYHVWVVFHCNLPFLFTIAVCSRRPADCTWPLAAICWKSPASKVPQNMKCEMYREKTKMRNILGTKKIHFENMKSANISTLEHKLEYSWVKLVLGAYSPFTQSLALHWHYALSRVYAHN